MKKVGKLISACLAALVLALNISAAPVIDVGRHGSITLYINDLETDEPITSGDFAIYRVASIDEKDGGYAFVLTEDFVYGSFDLTNTASARFAISAAEYVGSHSVAQYASARLYNGILKFDDLPAGLYLVINTVAADGYYTLNPFVFSIPDMTDGEVIYDVIAEPKPEPLKPQGWTPPPPPVYPPEYPPVYPPDEPNEPNEPDEPGEPFNPDEPVEPTDQDEVEIFDNDDSPQTGDSEKLYVWVLGMTLSASAAAAAVVFYMKRKKDSRKGENE